MSINKAVRHEKWSCQGYEWTVFICDGALQGLITKSTVTSIQALHESKSKYDYKIEVRNLDTCLLTPSLGPAIELKILLDEESPLANICIPPQLCRELRSLLHFDDKQSTFSGGLRELDGLTVLRQTSGDVVFDNVLLGHALGQKVPISIKFAKSSRPNVIKESLAKLVSEFEKTGDTTVNLECMKFTGVADDPGLDYDMVMGPETWRPLVASSRRVMKMAAGAMSCDVLSV